jgi:hypothetical protein
MGQWARSPLVQLTSSPQPSGLSLAFSYFCNSETSFDYTTVILRWYGANEVCLGDTILDRLSGVIGQPDLPAHYIRAVSLDHSPSGTKAVQVAFECTSDGGWSDEDGMWDTPCGPIGIDSVTVSTEAAAVSWDFDGGADGWTFGILGHELYTGVVSQETWQPWLDYVGVPGCRLGGRAWKFVGQDTSPLYPPGVPISTYQQAISGPVPRGAFTDWPVTVIEWDDYTCNPWFPNWWGLDGRSGYMFYPYTTPQDPTPRWSPRMGADVGSWVIWLEPHCGHRVFNLSTLEGYPGTPIPADWDSMKVVFELRSDWWSPYPGWIDSKGGPLLDNVRVGLVRDAASAVEGTPHPDAASLDLRVSPNPIWGEALIEFRLPRAGETRLRIFGVDGGLVRDLVLEALPAGQHTLPWDGGDDSGRPVRSGIYWAVVTDSDGRSRSERFVVLQ